MQPKRPRSRLFPLCIAFYLRCTVADWRSSQTCRCDIVHRLPFGHSTVELLTLAIDRLPHVPTVKASREPFPHAAVAEVSDDPWDICRTMCSPTRVDWRIVIAAHIIACEAFAVVGRLELLSDDDSFFWWRSGRRRLRRFATSRLFSTVSAFPKSG
jgi:hypothetical protein